MGDDEEVVHGRLGRFTDGESVDRGQEAAAVAAAGEDHGQVLIADPEEWGRCAVGPAAVGQFFSSDPDFRRERRIIDRIGVPCEHKSRITRLLDLCKAINRLFWIFLDARLN
jgi:hypothetical protein